MFLNIVCASQVEEDKQQGFIYINELLCPYNIPQTENHCHKSVYPPVDLTIL